MLNCNRRNRFIRLHDILHELGFEMISETVQCDRRRMSYVPEEKEYKVTFIGKDGGVLTVNKTAKIRGVRYLKTTTYFSDMVAARTLID